MLVDDNVLTPFLFSPLVWGLSLYPIEEISPSRLPALTIANQFSLCLFKRNTCHVYVHPQVALIKIIWKYREVKGQYSYLEHALFKTLFFNIFENIYSWSLLSQHRLFDPIPFFDCHLIINHNIKKEKGDKLRSGDFWGPISTNPEGVWHQEASTFAGRVHSLYVPAALIKQRPWEMLELPYIFILPFFYHNLWVTSCHPTAYLFPSAKEKIIRCWHIQ